MNNSPNADFISEFNKYYSENNISLNYIVKFDYPCQSKSEYIEVNDYSIYLRIIVKRRKDINAVELMNNICSIADKTGVNIYLQVIPMNVFAFRDFEEITSENQIKLEKYYCKFGFKTAFKGDKLTSSGNIIHDIFMVRTANEITN